MKASELRLGNWVEQPNDGVTRVTAVLNDLQIKTETEYVDKYCIPIPLTEEWLLKFGFEYVEEGCGYFDQKHAVYLWENGDVEFHPFCTNDRDCQIFIQHVHQLQNLYFALTGEELD